jgi:hypothetical protein
MMQSILALLAGLGPAVLTFLGIAAALSGSDIEGERRWLWPAILLVVGVPVTIAALLVLRSGHETQTASALGSAPVSAAAHNAAVAQAAQPTYQAYPAYRPHTYWWGAGHNAFHLHPYRPNAPRAVYWVPPRLMTNPVPPTPVPAKLTSIPPNTLSCEGFTKDPDGNWQANSDTQPFNVNDATGILIRNQGPIVAGWVSVGGVDLFRLLDAKCGGHG